MQGQRTAKLITTGARARLVRKVELLRKSLRGIGKKKGEAAGEFLSDWHDNAAYEQLDREFQMTSRRISEMEDLLNGAQSAEVVEQKEKVSIGSTAEVLIDGHENTLTIGCLGESEPDLDLIAYVSPIGRVLMGLREGEVKKGKVGTREVEVKVIRLHPPSFRYNALQEKLNAALDAEKPAASAILQLTLINSDPSQDSFVRLGA